MPADAGGEDQAFYDGVGAELRAERQRCGLSLDEVSARLRIRIAHLEAIEAGRFGDLPGRIYAIGFLRSYAEYLGADGDVCVSLFKAEVGPGGHSRKLTFPVPADENRRPGWTTLLVSVLLAAVVYGGWVAYQDLSGDDVELVGEVPAKLAEHARVAAESGVVSAQAAEGAGKAEEGDTTAAAVTVREADLAVVGREAVQRDAAEDEARVAGGAEAEASSPGEAVAGDVAPAVSATTGETTEPTDGTVTEGPAVESASSSEPAPVVSEPGTVAERTELAMAPPPPVPRVEPNDGYVPRVLGVANRDSRVIVRATEVAQIIVKQKDGRTLMPHRVMQPGDIYRAPNLPGVILESDNIGSLQILLDGRLLGRGDRLSGGTAALSLDLEQLQAATN